MLDFRYTLRFLCLFLLCSCSKDDRMTNSTESAAPNILLIIADDLGKDAINGYNEGIIKPFTPTLDSIRTNGIIFHNFWVNPTCTPTRASILTGKYGFRTDVKGVGDVLSSTEVSLQKYISQNNNNSYATAVIGKWHLSGNDSNFNPESFEIDYYAGLIRGTVDDYYQWQLSEDSNTSVQSEYTTEVFTDLAINWLETQNKPWFLWLAYNAPHIPFHVPPLNMHSQGELPEYQEGENPIPYYMAAIEAIDFQIGRLLSNLTHEEKENTLVIFIGDNGSPTQVAQSPFLSTKVKSTLYQGGINVPMFISGKNVLRIGEDYNLISGTDLFATIAESSGVNINEYQDSKSFKSLFTEPSSIRDYQYSEIRNNTFDAWTISNGRFKLIERSNGVQELYDLNIDPYEQTDLTNESLSTEQSEAKLELENELENIRQ